MGSFLALKKSISLTDICYCGDQPGKLDFWSEFASGIISVRTIPITSNRKQKTKNKTNATPPSSQAKKECTGSELQSPGLLLASGMVGTLSPGPTFLHVPAWCHALPWVGFILMFLSITPSPNYISLASPPAGKGELCLLLFLLPNRQMFRVRASLY